MMPILVIPLAGQKAGKGEKTGSLRAISLQMIPYISGPASKAVGEGGCGQVYLSCPSLVHKPQMRNHGASSSSCSVSHLDACQQQSGSDTKVSKGNDEEQVDRFSSMYWRERGTYSLNGTESTKLAL